MSGPADQTGFRRFQEDEVLVNLVNLDDQAIYAQGDPQGMLNHLHSFPEMSGRAWNQAQEFELPRSYSAVNKILILGMGGSAIGGDLVNSLVSRQARVPILICRDYDLPAYVDELTLVVASSYSGATEETLSAFQQALKINCPKLAITTGGQLKELSDKQGLPVFSYEYRSQPRAALPFSFFPLLGILTRLKVISQKSEEVAETLNHLYQLAAEINEKAPVSQNLAKSLALDLFGKLVVVYGDGLTRDVAQRWKAQINENSKSLAFYESFSELNHNAVVGYSFPRQILDQSHVVMLSSKWLHQRIISRYSITQELLKKSGIAFTEVQGHGSSPLCQMMTLVFLGDYLSYYLALLNQVDPTPVESIDILKGRLAKLS
jgi:glucose/mannose-6-phosphate isomerase